MSQDGKRFTENEEFNKLILGPFEISTFDLAERKFQQMSTYSDGYEYVEYYLCPKDSLKKFSNYKLPKELEKFRINYPFVYITKYYFESESERKIEEFDFYGDQFFKTTLK
jgi:hypothetical protein